VGAGRDPLPDHDGRRARPRAERRGWLRIRCRGGWARPWYRSGSR
jgi:hypothetical protein